MYLLLFGYAMLLQSVVSEALLLAVHFLAPLEATEKQSLLDACTRAFNGGTCVEAEANSADEEFHGYVEASDSEHVLLEVKVHGSSQQLYSSREISFQPADERMERARSLGLSLGVLASALREEQEEAETLPPQESSPLTAETPQAIKKKNPEKAARTSSARSARAKHEDKLLLGLAAGIDVIPSWPAVSPSADFHAVFFPDPLLLVSGRFSLTYQGGSSDETTLRYLSPSLGAGVHFAAGSSQILITAEGGAELVTGYLPDDFGAGDAPGQVKQAERWVANIRLGGDFLVPIAKSFHLSLSPAAIFSLTPLEFDVDGVSQGSTGVVRFSFRAGIAWLY